MLGPRNQDLLWGLAMLAGLWALPRLAPWLGDMLLQLSLGLGVAAFILLRRWLRGY
jgi:hypothetical protein